MITQRIAQYIEKEKLLTMQDKVLVTLSGGADSVAMLRILLSLGYKCEAAHCNFRLRGKESDEDELFVRQLCAQLHVSLHTIHFDTEEFAREEKISIEMAARELRYRWFARLKETHQFSTVAVAHHQDDSVETMLLNLIRGTGINGLLGIRPRNEDVVRPLLCVTRHEIVNYLDHIKQQYVIDSTNLQDEYIRNKIRLKILPLMQEINPSVKNGMMETSSHLREVAHVYAQAIEEGKLRVTTESGIVISKLLAEPSPQALLFEILYPLGFTSAQVVNIMEALHGQSGKVFVGKSGCRVIKDRTLLLIDREKPIDTDAPPFQLKVEHKEYTPSFVIPTQKHIACFDADKLVEPLAIRKWEHGDSFVPFGMKGKKKVSDFLTDRKFSIAQKERQWVLCSDQRIAWVIGERTDGRFRIDDSTRKVVIITLQ